MLAGDFDDCVFPTSTMCTVPAIAGLRFRGRVRISRKFISLCQSIAVRPRLLLDKFNMRYIFNGIDVVTIRRDL